VTPMGGWEALPAFTVPVALLAGTGVIVLAQIPTAVELAGLVLVIAGVALHRPRDHRSTPTGSPIPTV
jgi:drug/metabolite transporter (DMT)-like permease